MSNVVETPQSICRFGLARGDVTPPVGIYNRMWGAAAHDRATGVHRPLTATAFLIGPGDPTAELPGGDLIAPYLDQLTERLAGLATEARSRARPATLCYGSGRCGLAANR